MSKVKFYKGESMSLVFSAYDKAGEPIDISGYEKEVTLFTPFSSRLIKSVTDVSNSAFSANITEDETLGFEQEGNFSIITEGLPTSPSGLTKGRVWVDGATLKIVT